MIRWYDYVLAVLAADVLTASAFISLTSDNLFISILFGSLSGVVYSLWAVDYCNFRLKQETK